ncbi:hypothetical protein [Serratia fonticola]|uniref:hypothetical protein n=1 Tax=Serratia fonticola TaxID=47917 RepID=UPI0010FCE45A|nr:hypothetical protein [Serratia fonticola]
MKGLIDISEVERLKIFKAIRVGCKDDDEFQYYLSLLCEPGKVDEYTRRVQGYFNEDEFVIICHLLNCCKRITPLGQTPLPNMEKGTPDYLATFKTNYGDLSCFIEVKSTANHETSSFSHNAIDRIYRYAESYGLPIFFASRITIGDCGVWVLQTREEFVENKRKTSINMLPNVIGNILMKDSFVMVTSDFEMEMTFEDTCNNNDSSVFYENYGYLKGINITANNDTYSFDNVLILDILLSSFAQEVHSIKTSNGYKVFKKASFGTSLPMSCLLLHLNTVISDNQKIKPYSNPSRLLAQVEVNNGLLFYIDKLKEMILAINGTFPPSAKIFNFSYLGNKTQTIKSKEKILNEIKRQKTLLKNRKGT